MPDELRLNSLDRFRKQSPRLVLEEHGHCEVPAGCGGVVLRWRNPFAARLFDLAVFTPTDATTWLDGVEPETGLIDLAVGPHAVAIHYPKMVRKEGVLMFALVSHDKVRATPPVPETKLQFISVAGGRWRHAGPVGDDWRSRDRRRGSALLVPQPLYEPGKSTYGLHQCTNAGAMCLGLPGKTTGRDVWIRHEFIVPGPEADA